MNICERGITVHFVYFCIFASLAVKTSVRKVNQATRR